MKRVISFSLVLFLLSACSNENELSWETKYDDDGRITAMIQPGGRNISFKYEMDPKDPDLVRKLTRRSKGEKVVTEFDRFGRKISMTDNIGKINYEYNLEGYLSAVKRYGFPTLSYDYNTLGQLTSIKTDDGYFVSYDYDFQGRVSDINSPAGKIAYEYYRAQGAVVRTLPNGISTRWTYGPENRLQEIVHIDKNNYILHSYTYTYSPDRLITNIEEKSQQGKIIKEYRYDSEKRLVSFSSSNGEELNYSYDALGNRISLKKVSEEIETASYDWAGRIVSRNGIPMKYDRAGNLISNQQGDKEYEYNSSNLLTQAGSLSYAYNGDGRLTKRTMDGQETSFVLNELTTIWQPLVISSNSTETYYIWDGNTILAQVENGEKTFFLHDHLGSPRNYYNGQGSLTLNQDYDPFGVPQNQVMGDESFPGFTGLFYDAQAGHYITSTRSYQPELARFLQMDPLKQVPGESQKVLSAFVYCGNDPVNFVDLNGMQPNSINNYDPFFLTHQFDHVRDNLIDYYSHDLLFKEPTYNSNQQISKDLIRNVNPVHNAYEYIENASKDLAKSAISRDIGISNELIPWEFVSAIGKVQKGYDILEVVPRMNQLSPNEKIDWLGSIAGLSSFMGAFAVPIATTTAKAYTGFVLDAFSYNPADKFMRDYGNTKTTYGPNTITRTSSVRYREVTKGGYKQITPLPSSRSISQPPTLSPTFPSNVGGVYLKGAGSALDSIQSLSGIAVDEVSGKIILLSEDKSEIDIPPLRLDDVVTIFRCVYDQGEAPYVSIDPDPSNPNGPVMLSRHGEETENTYVGWILFETDRVMKAYSLGQDNVTNQTVETSISGYQEVLDAKFDRQPGKQTWERYWIVPAEINKRQSQKKELTLYDIPLKVKTEKMIMRNGKLETDPVGKSSKGAAMFSDWFSRNYDKIATENYSLPPEGIGFDEPVPIFRELRRMALITAIAEQLRDQGVPFPLWMRDYEVKKFQTPPTTPAITITKEGTNSTITIYGGVSLNTTDKSIEKEVVTPEAIHLLETTKKEIRSAPMLQAKSYKSEDKEIRALALPGNNTKGLSPCRLNEVDLAIPLRGGGYLTFIRQFNSFFNPRQGIFNGVWTMNLPRLENPTRQMKSSGNEMRVEMNHFLITTPLNDYFQDNVTVYDCDDSRIRTSCMMCVLKNGDKCYFNNDGYLVAHRSGLLYQYIRNDNNQIIEISAWKGRRELGSLYLFYDSNNRLSSISSTEGEKIKYTYSLDGILKYVIKPDETILYSYTEGNNLIESITVNDKLFRQYIYNEKAQLIAQSGEFGELKNSIVQNGENYDMLQLDGEDSQQNRMVYDYAMRPLKLVEKDNSETTWDYSDPERIRINYKARNGSELKITRSHDNTSEYIEYPEGNKVDSRYDPYGNLTAMFQNGEQLLSQEYYSDGSLKSSKYETFSISPEYDEYGEASGITLSDSDPDKARTSWQHTQFDEFGNVTSMQDYSGFGQQNIYDPDGNLVKTVSNQGEMIIDRDLMNRPRSIRTSWGLNMENSYTEDGDIQSVTISGEDGTAVMIFDNGTLKNYTDYNGSKTDYNYYMQGENQGQLDQIRKDNLLIDYGYNGEGDLTEVKVNDTFRWKYENEENSRKITLSKPTVVDR